MKRVLVPVLALAAALGAERVQAQSMCDGATGRDPLAAAGEWRPPLTQVITVHAREIPLREVLNRVATAAAMRLSYSAELLPVDRPVCASYEGVATGDVLSDLLRGTGVGLVVTGSDHVVLAPVRVPARVQPQQTPTVYPLDPLIVEAPPADAAFNGSSVAVDLIDGRRLARQSTGTLAEAMNGAVPGIWVWAASPYSLSARFASVRGASSFGMSHPKVYIDGIEVANPLLVTRIQPESIDRIEVIRGPQGGASFGADALSGVTNIITRHDVPESGAPRTRVHSRFGFANSDFVNGAVLAQEHAVNLRTGSAHRSGALNLALGGSGEFVPDGFEQYLQADASGRLIGDQSIVTGTLRLFAERAAMPASPLLTDSAFTGSDPRSVVQYTAGLTAKYLHNAYWTHSLVLGFDGYGLAGLSDDPRSFLSSADSALRAAGASALRASLRFSSIGQRELGAGLAGALTLTAEHSVLRQRGVWQDLGTYSWSHDAGASWSSSGSQHWGSTTGHHTSNAGSAFAGVLPQSAQTDIVELRRNTGLGAQVSVDAQDRVFLNGGLRLEHQGGPDGIGQLATLPTIGAAFANTIGVATLKLRAAWGKGIRWPDMPARPRTSYGVLRARALAPEQQTGTEAGFDLAVGNALSFQVTRFDQTASGLIQDVATYIPEQRVAGGLLPNLQSEKPLYVSELQNVGEIDNRGWEMAATVRRGRLALAGTFGLVDSRVRQVAPGYTGDLQPGDRMLAVPARTSSLTAAWQDRGWSGSLTAYRAADWVNYDRVALARAVLANDSPAPLEGTELRSYWREYDGITHLHAALTRDLRRGLTLTLRGENLLDKQVGEPDNITVLPGRTISVGVRAAF